MQSGSPTQFGFPFQPPTSPWAAQILEEIQDLKSKFKAIESIEKNDKYYKLKGVELRIKI